MRDRRQAIRFAVHLPSGLVIRIRVKPIPAPTAPWETPRGMKRLTPFGTCVQLDPDAKQVELMKVIGGMITSTAHEGTTIFEIRGSAYAIG